MGKKHSKRGTTHTTSILTAIFAIAPAAYVLTTTPAGAGASFLGGILGGGGSWQSIAGAFWSLSQVVIQNWVSILILLAVSYVAIAVVRKLGRGARITKHLRA